jgi:hypothetical protein
MGVKADNKSKQAAGARNRRVSSKAPAGSLPPKPARQNSIPPPPGPKPSAEAKATPKRGRGAAVIGAVVGMLVGAGGITALSWASGCGTRASSQRHHPPLQSTSSPVARHSAPVDLSSATRDDSNEPEVAEPDAPKKEVEADKPWQGPWIGALAHVTPIYPTARFSKNRLGYLRHGGKAPVIDKPIQTDACKQGFYPLVDGGYVCGKYATTQVADARVKTGVKAPDLEGDLPYKYAYNTAHGTPLYIQVPSREDMLRYEPYLKDRGKKKAKDGEPDKAIEKADQPRPDDSARPIESAVPPATSAAPSPSAVGSAVPLDPDAGAPPLEDPDAGDKPWWQRDKDKPLDVKLSDLDEGDGTLSKRMVKGFFIAVDRGFSWNNRLWYKTTDGLIAPSDRMIIPKTPDLKGFEFPTDDSKVKLAGFIRMPGAFRYEKSKDGKSFVKKGKVERFAAFGLTGNTELSNRLRFYETSDGWWMRETDGAVAEPSKRPDRVSSDEKWLDVNLTHKTITAMLGDKPVYAALISPGKTSPVKEKDHRTKTGIFRIREKHVATTMDGDGAAAGDLPYSIMDVPYVQYYDGSFALHAAFWHSNFGREQSHGCVNLSPRDAKWVFGWTEPALPRGWHGVWASEKRRGTWVVIHE